jgi:hypothetical protein
MSLKTCAGLTYKQIWEEYKKEPYPYVSEHDRLLIHRKWKALGSSVWKGVVFK